MWDLNFLTRNGTHSPCTGEWSFKHYTASKSLLTLAAEAVVMILKKKKRAAWQVLPYLQFQFSSVQSLSRVWLFAIPWTAARQASLSIINSWSLLKLMSIESVKTFNHLILCHPLLLLPSTFPSIRVFSNESALHITWPNYWSFSSSISPSNEHPGLISFRMDWLDLLAVQGTLKRVFSNTTVQSTNSSVLSFPYSPTLIHTWLLEKP